MVIVLNMKFPKNNLPDIGSIRLDRNGEYLHLLTADIPKLNSTVTRAVCVGTYGVPVFYFKSGDVAFTDDTQRAFVYNEVSDSWHEWEI